LFYFWKHIKPPQVFLVTNLLVKSTTFTSTGHQV
jgi:hypothetical protein